MGERGGGWRGRLGKGVGKGICMEHMNPCKASGSHENAANCSRVTASLHASLRMHVPFLGPLAPCCCRPTCGHSRVCGTPRRSSSRS